MLDFWETVGRLLTNAALRNSLFTDAMLTAVNNPDPKGRGLLIPNAKYLQLGVLMAGVNRHQPMSVLAQGELLRVIPDAGFRKPINDLAALLPNLGMVSEHFLATLGALTTDNQFRSKFQSFLSLAEAQKFFPGLVQTDFDTLKSVVASTAPGSFSDLATKLCDGEWSPVCFVLAVPYAVDPQLHPVVKA